MVTIINTPYEKELDHPFSFKLDDFQKHAINLLNNETPCNILITAHTGSGKSLPAEYAILRAVELGKKIIYCSPIKTLSNQKFYEFNHKYPNLSFGIITGDNKHNPMADCLIMTTEILMLMLSKNSIKIKDIDYQINIEDDVFAIIFDEVHYINDADRGNVWEKSIMMIPKNITILMLSATIAKAENFLEWVHSCNDNKSYLLTNERRVVPLIFNYLTFSTKLPKALIPYENYLNKLVPIMNTNDFKIDLTSMNTFIELQKYFDKNKINLKWLINYTCKYLSINNLCPALFFVFSKKTCFYLAESVTEHFNTDVEARQVEKDIQFYLSKLEHKEDYMKTNQYYQILDLAKKGIAVHHSGLIPVFKEIIEMLFSKNQIKILFATETFSVGLNMPTKSVIFTDVFKYDNNGKRMLYSHEFIQMSGRAGRRGLDDVGHVILLPQTNILLERNEFQKLLTGKSQQISSKFKINENIILETLESELPLSDIVKKTLLNTELNYEKQFLDKKIKTSENLLTILEDIEIFKELDEINARLSDIIQPSKNTKKQLISRKKELESSEIYKNNCKNYISNKSSIKQLEDAISDREYIENYLDFEIKKKTKYLIDNGYILDNSGLLTLTVKGKTSLFFREMDSIIGTEIVFSEYVDSLNEREFVCLLTLITEGQDADNEIPYPEIAQYISNSFPDIAVNRRDLQCMLDWFDQKHITQINFSFEGDLIKTVNRVINYLDEIKNAYIFLNKLENVEAISSIQIKLLRDIISTESLYIKFI